MGVLTHEYSAKHVDRASAETVESIHGPQYGDQSERRGDERVGECLVAEADREVKHGAVLRNESLPMSGARQDLRAAHLTSALLRRHDENDNQGATEIGAAEKRQPGSLLRLRCDIVHNCLDFQLAFPLFDCGLRSDKLERFESLLLASLEYEPPGRVGDKGQTAAHKERKDHGDANRDEPSVGGRVGRVRLVDACGEKTADSDEELQARHCRVSCAECGGPSD